MAGAGDRAVPADGRRIRAKVDVVLGPTTGGVILAYECARQLGVRGIFAEEVEATASAVRRRELRRGFAIAPGERVLLVDDVITTGGSLLAMLPVVEEANGELVGISVLVDRSGGLPEVESPQTGRRYPVHALWTLTLPTYEPGPALAPAARPASRWSRQAHPARRWPRRPEACLAARAAPLEIPVHRDEISAFTDGRSRLFWAAVGCA